MTPHSTYTGPSRHDLQCRSQPLGHKMASRTELTLLHCAAEDSLILPKGACRAYTILSMTRKTVPPCQCPLCHKAPPSFACRRRDLWHGRDMAGAGRRRALWNEALLGEAVAPLLAQAMELAAQQLGE